MSQQHGGRGASDANADPNSQVPLQGDAASHPVSTGDSLGTRNQMPADAETQVFKVVEETPNALDRIKQRRGLAIKPASGVLGGAPSGNSGAPSADVDARPGDPVPPVAQQVAGNVEDNADALPPTGTAATPSSSVLTPDEQDLLRRMVDGITGLQAAFQRTDARLDQVESNQQRLLETQEIVLNLRTQSERQTRHMDAVEADAKLTARRLTLLEQAVQGQKERFAAMQYVPIRTYDRTPAPHTLGASATKARGPTVNGVPAPLPSVHLSRDRTPRSVQGSTPARPDTVDPRKRLPSTTKPKAASDARPTSARGSGIAGSVIVEEDEDAFVPMKPVPTDKKEERKQLESCGVRDYTGKGPFSIWADKFE